MNCNRLSILITKHANKWYFFPTKSKVPINSYDYDPSPALEESYKSIQTPFMFGVLFKTED